MTMVKEGTMTFADLFRPGFEPSRAIGPAMEGSPEETWLKDQPLIESLSRGLSAPVPTPTVSPAVTATTVSPAASQPAVAPPDEIDVVFLEAGVARFGGKDLYLNAQEIDAISRHLIDAYTRQQSEERFSLILKYLQPQPGEGSEVQESSGAGEEVVLEMHQGQEEVNFPPKAVLKLRHAMYSGPGEMRSVQREEPREDAPAPKTRHKVPRKATRRKAESN